MTGLCSSSPLPNGTEVIGDRVNGEHARFVSEVGGDEKWLRRVGTDLSPRARLFCFPHAGGTAREYRGWRHHLAPDIELVCVEPPGRAERLSEPAYRDATRLVHDLLGVLEPSLDRPFALFGHSMGALLALELAYQLSDRGLPTPLHLFLSARPSPHTATARTETHLFEDDALWEVVDRRAAIPPAVREDQGFQELFLPLFRADMELVETYTPTGRAPLQIPITALGGREDDCPPPEELGEWAPYTSAGFRERVFSGGHFFLRAEEREIVALIEAALSSV